MFLAHAPISFLANELIQKKKISQLKQNEKILIGIVALLCGLLPDIDMMILLATTTPTFMHHSLISHAPLFYIALWGILKLVFWVGDKLFNKNTKKIFNPEFTNVLVNTFLIGTLFHLLADIFAEDIMLFYPFSTQYFTIFKYLFEPSLFAGYFHSISFGFEVIFCAIFFVYIFNILFKKGKLLKGINIGIMVLASFFFVYTVYIHINTYNRSILYDASGKASYDIDYDTLSDGLDMDVDNDGRDNIVDVDLKSLVSQIKDIISTGKWTANSDSNSLMDKFKYESGGFTSFRLITQAYWNLHSPISPVLKDMLVKENSNLKYSWDFNSSDAFYKYFNDKNMLIELNKEAGVTLPQGTLLFVLDNNDNVLNMGIALEDNNMGIVLPYDNKLQMHTYKEVNNYYKSDVKFFTTK